MGCQHTIFFSSSDDVASRSPGLLDLHDMDDTELLSEVCHFKKVPCVFLLLFFFFFERYVIS